VTHQFACAANDEKTKAESDAKKAGRKAQKAEKEAQKAHDKEAKLVVAKRNAKTKLARDTATAKAKAKAVSFPTRRVSRVV